MTEPAGLLDTSVFIARETARPLGELPERVAISVITLAELELGLRAADDPAVRARRGDTLSLARAADPVPVSESVMSKWADLVWICRQAGIHRTVKMADALIAATAMDLGLPVVTQDADYEQMAIVQPALRVIRV